MLKLNRILLLAAASLLTTPAFAGFDESLAAVQHAWAHANYVTPEKQKAAELKGIAAEAAALAQANAGRAEPLIWQAIVLSTEAKYDGGLGALGMIKDARKLLQQAEKIDATALDGSVYTSLGSLYAKAPGWPIAFGDKDKAGEYLRKALAINPDGIDPNFFYGELLADRGDKAGARTHLLKAQAAPARPGREDADAGRREEIRAALAKLE